MATRKTKNPRISFVPSDKVRRVMLELADTSGKSMASIVSEIMDEAATVMEGQLKAFKMIASAPEQARDVVQAYANKATADIAQAVMTFEKEQLPKKPAKKKPARGSSGPT